MKALKNNICSFIMGMAPVWIPVVMIVLIGAIAPVFGIR